MPNFFRGRFAPRLSALMLVVAMSPSRALSSPPVIEIDSSPGRFSPEAIVIRVGETTKLRFVQEEGIHGIALPELGIPQTILTPANPVAFDVTPKQPGIYVVHCEIVCGVNHKSMMLTVRVER